MSFFALTWVLAACYLAEVGVDYDSLGRGHAQHFHFFHFTSLLRENFHFQSSKDQQ